MVFMFIFFLFDCVTKKIDFVRRERIWGCGIEYGRCMLSLDMRYVSFDEDGV